MTCRLQQRHNSQWILFDHNLTVLAILDKPHGTHQWTLGSTNMYHPTMKFNSPGDCVEWLNDALGMVVELSSRADAGQRAVANMRHGN